MEIHIIRDTSKELFYNKLKYREYIFDTSGRIMPCKTQYVQAIGKQLN